MKDKTFIKILAVLMVIGVGTTIGMMIYGYQLWQQISIVEMIANWG